MAAVANCGSSGEDQPPDDEKNSEERVRGNFIGGYLSSDSADDEDVDELEAFDQWLKRKHGSTERHKVIRKPKTLRDIRYNRAAIASKKFREVEAKLPYYEHSEKENSTNGLDAYQVLVAYNNMLMMQQRRRDTNQVIKAPQGKKDDNDDSDAKKDVRK